jgi:hypothetical protein
LPRILIQCGGCLDATVKKAVWNSNKLRRFPKANLIIYSALELAEGVERRGLAKGNLVEYHRGRTQRRETLPQAHDWVRQVLCACASSLEAGARCGSAARRDLCGGCRVTGIPTATNPKRYMSLREDVRRQRMV